MRAPGPLSWVVGGALAVSVGLALASAASASDNPFAGTWVGKGRLDGHSACASDFTMHFVVAPTGEVSGGLEMSRGTHGFSGSYRITGQVDENDGRLSQGRASKSWTVELHGDFSAQSARGRVVFTGEADCYGEWSATGEVEEVPAAKRAPSGEPAAVPPARPACGDMADVRRRLEALDKLLKGGLITEDEAANKRMELLACL